MRQFHVAILGATGLVGQEFIKVLEQRKFPAASVRLLASEASAGKSFKLFEDEIKVEKASSESFEGTEIALFSAGSVVDREFAPIAARAGAVVIDNSAVFRMQPDVPLVIPEVNPEDIEWHKGIIANPNCSTIQMVIALNPLHRVNPISRIIVDSYQSVSGTGKQALDELTSQAQLILEGKEVFPQTYPHRIAFNLFPQIDAFLENGYTKEEWKLVEETRKILHAPELPISATCVRVPVYIGHSEAIHAEFARPMSPEEARDILSQASGVAVVDEPGFYPTPWEAAGRDEVFVGRIRRDVSHPSGLAMWVVSDNLRKGAALNAVQIAEELIRRNWL